MWRILVALALMYSVADAQPVLTPWRPPAGCSTNDVIKFNGTAWVCGAVSSFSTNNVIPKGNGTALVASAWSDSGSVSTYTGGIVVFDPGSSAGRLRFTGTGGANYIQSGIADSGGSAAPLIFTNMNAGAEWARFDSSGNFSLEGALTVDGNATIGDTPAVDTTTINGATTIVRGTTTAQAAYAGTVLTLTQGDGVHNYLTLRGNAVKGINFANTSDGADGSIKYDDLGRGFQFVTVGQNRFAIDSVGTLFAGDTASSSINSNVDVLALANTGTGQSTSGVALLEATHAGSFTTAGGDVTYYGTNISLSATESAGGNVLTAIGVRSSVTAGDERISGYFSTGAATGVATALTGTMFILEQADGTPGYLQFRSNNLSGIAWAGGGTGADGKVVYDKTTNAMSIATAGTFRQHIDTNGTVYMGDTAGTLANSNVDILTLGNTGTANTADGKSLLRATSTAAFDTNGGDITAYGVHASLDLTDETGTDFELRAVALYGNAEVNEGTAYALYTNDGEVNFEGPTTVDNILVVTGGINMTGNLVVNSGSAVTIGSATSFINGHTTSFDGKIETTGTDPTLSTCGSSPTITGSDTGGRVTPGTGSPGACTITFSSTFGSTPACVITHTSTDEIWISAQSATAITVTTTGGDVIDPFNYVCLKI